jgi:thiamine-phosphate pyrophosphorylase
VRVCLVTDRRRRLPASLDSAAAQEAFLDHLRAAAAAGVDLIQIREPDLETADLLRMTRRAVDIVRGTAVRIVVNERADVALAAGAHGVHLRAGSAPAARVRRWAPPGFLIGRSVHSAAEAVAVTQAGGTDYLILGTVFPSQSKPDGHPTIGVAEVARAVRQIEQPVLAIGGVTLERAAALAEAGAAGVAAIGLFDPPHAGGEETAKSLAEIGRFLRILFDTGGEDPYHQRDGRPSSFRFRPPPQGCP